MYVATENMAGKEIVSMCDQSNDFSQRICIFSMVNLQVINEVPVQQPQMFLGGFVTYCNFAAHVSYTALQRIAE